MTQVTINTTQNNKRDTRRWMVFTFIAGMVFAVVLAQTMVAANRDFPGTNYNPVSPGYQDSLTPSPMPDDNCPLDKNLYVLVYACPWREAILSG
jgi:hypothetical protein